MSSGPCGELGGPGHDRRAAALSGESRRHLVAHLVDRLGRRTDPGDAHARDRACEVGVLREEPVAGVHRVGAALTDRVEDGFGVEVALGCGLPAECERLVGEPHVEGIPVELGVHGDGLDAELASGADDAHCDLAAVGDQDLLEHGCQCRWYGSVGPFPRIGWGIGCGLRTARRLASGADAVTLLDGVARPRHGQHEFRSARCRVRRGAPPYGARDRPPDRRPRSSRPEVGRPARREPVGVDAVPRRARPARGAHPSRRPRRDRRGARHRRRRRAARRAVAQVAERRAARWPQARRHPRPTLPRRPRRRRARAERRLGSRRRGVTRRRRARRHARRRARRRAHGVRRASRRCHRPVP